jgi:hypothetical protein
MEGAVASVPNELARISPKPHNHNHVSLVVPRVVPHPKKMRQTARMSAGGKVPRHCLVSRNHVTNLRCRECMRVPVKDLPGEWDHHLPERKERGSTPEWKPSKEKIKEKLWGDLAKSIEQFRQTYDLMMGVL